ncbi:MAG: AAA family ATPase [Methanomicrobiales archaeon]
MTVIGVVGLPASGKGEFSEVAHEMGIPVVVMGDIVRQAVREAGMELTDENAGVISRRIREEEGMDALARRTVPIIEARQNDPVVVDGIRGDAEVQVFRDQFPNFILVAVEAPFSVRLDRLRDRGREDITATAADLARRDDRERGWGLDRAMAMADIVLDNSGSREEFREQVRQLLLACGGV